MVRKKQHLPCYVCGSPSTSNEHVPPDCLFPQGHKVNLITVPSCDKHNSEKSGNDEYLKAILSSYIKNDLKLQIQLLPSILRSFEKIPQKREDVISGAHPTQFDGKPAYSLQVDYTRIEQEFTYNAHGVFYKEFKKIWNSPFQIFCTAIPKVEVNKDTKIYNQNSIKIERMAEQLLRNKPKNGENREIFYYQILLEENYLTIRMVYYSEITVTALSESSSSLDKRE